MFHQMGRSLCLAPRAARGADAAAFAGEGHQFLLVAAVAAQAQKAVGEDAAGQKRFELVDDKGWQARTASLDINEGRKV